MRFEIRIGFFEFGTSNGCRYWIREVNSVLGKYAWGVTLHNAAGDGGWTDTPEAARNAVKKRIAKEAGTDGSA